MHRAIPYARRVYVTTLLMVSGFTFLSRLTQIAPPSTRFVFLGAGIRLGLPSHPALDGTQRRTSARGTTKVIGQKIQVGLRHAGRSVTIEINDTTLRVLDDHDELITIIPRTSRKELHRFKAYGKNTNRNTG